MDPARRNSSGTPGFAPQFNANSNGPPKIYGFLALLEIALHPLIEDQKKDEGTRYKLEDGKLVAMAYKDYNWWGYNAQGASRRVLNLTGYHAHHNHLLGLREEIDAFIQNYCHSNDEGMKNCSIEFLTKYVKPGLASMQIVYNDKSMKGEIQTWIDKIDQEQPDSEEDVDEGSTNPTEKKDEGSTDSPEDKKVIKKNEKQVNEGESGTKTVKQVQQGADEKSRGGGEPSIKSENQQSKTSKETQKSRRSRHRSASDNTTYEISKKPTTTRLTRSLNAKKFLAQSVITSEILNRVNNIYSSVYTKTYDKELIIEQIRKIINGLHDELKSFEELKIAKKG